MNVKEKIQKLIDDNDICLFMKGTPESYNVDFQWPYRMS